MARRDKELSPAELKLFFSNLELVYHSGLPLTEGFDILRSNAQTASEKRRLEVLYQAVTGGLSLYEALKKQGDLPDYALSLIRIGEETGRMEETFAGLNDYYGKRDALAQSIRSSLTYPLSMLIVVLAVVIVLLTQAMPVFDQVFRQLGFQMTGVAATLLDVGALLSSYALVFAGGIAALVALVVILRLLPFGKRLFRTLFQAAPFTRSLSLSLSTQRFALALSSLLQAGLSVDAALEYAEPLVDDKRARRSVRLIREHVGKGESFLTAVERSRLFPASTMALLAVGFKTGTDAEAFDQIGEQIALTAEHKTDGLVAAIEPTLVVVMCLLVGVILLSVMLPLLGALTGF
ncbi:MAG: type II secretion system F family protein [Coriobacteriales bacterium]|jgi:type IV pilus assembly protein PilC|nr:type II secretion system F family protein [Coriobacteriales bacterium]